MSNYKITNHFCFDVLNFIFDFNECNLMCKFAYALLHIRLFPIYIRKKQKKKQTNELINVTHSNTIGQLNFVSFYKINTFLFSTFKTHADGDCKSSLLLFVAKQKKKKQAQTRNWETEIKTICGVNKFNYNTYSEFYFIIFIYINSSMSFSIYLMIFVWYVFFLLLLCTLWNHFRFVSY